MTAQALRDAGHGRVAVVDLDAHHGNGTQALFYDRADVFYGSLHVDPGAGWFPHYVGFADETGTGAGAGATHNLPLAPAPADIAWLDAVERLRDAVAEHGSTALVVSLGVDAAADDPECRCRSPRTATSARARCWPGSGCRRSAVQEGGYHLPTLGPLVVAALAGLAS